MSETANSTDKTENTDILPFEPVTLSDRKRVDSYMQPNGQSSCQHSFVLLFTYSEKYGSEICERDGFLFTLRRGLCTEDRRVYLAPIGSGDLESAYSAVLSDAAAHGCKAVFQTVTKEQVAFLKKHFPGRFAYSEIRDYAEYIYFTDDLYRMDCDGFGGKRNAVRSILRRYGDRLELRLITSDSLSDIRLFVRKWFESLPKTYDETAVRLMIATVQKQLDHYDELDLLGIGAYIDGEMVGFNFGAAINGDCFDGLIIEARRDIPNLYTLLYWGMSCLCAPAFTYFNWEEDVGVPGLRRMKMRFRPAVLMRKYLAEELSRLSDTPDSEDIPVLTDVEIYPSEELIPGSIEELSEYKNAKRG